MTADLARAVQVVAPKGVVEVRALAENAVHSGYFDDRTELAKRAEVLDADPSVGGIYITLNAVNPALLSRRANRIKMRLSKKDATTADADILRRRWLPVDIDPVRPSGVSSTGEEHDLALAAAADLVKNCLATLNALFSNEQVTVDTAVHNAADTFYALDTLRFLGALDPSGRGTDGAALHPKRAMRGRVCAGPDIIPGLMGIFDDFDIRADSLDDTIPHIGIVRAWITDWISPGDA